MRMLLAAGLSILLITSGCAPRPLGASESPAQTALATARSHRHTQPAATQTPQTSAASSTNAPSTKAPAPLPAVLGDPRTRGVSGLLDGVVPDPSSEYGVLLEELASGARTGVNETAQFP